jgi:hypothetical protein
MAQKDAFSLTTVSSVALIVAALPPTVALTSFFGDGALHKRQLFWAFPMFVPSPSWQNDQLSVKADKSTVFLPDP